MKKEKLVHTNYRISEELRRQFRAYCVRRGLNSGKALGQAIELFLSTKKSESEKEAAHV